MPPKFFLFQPPPPPQPTSHPEFQWARVFSFCVFFPLPQLVVRLWALTLVFPLTSVISLLFVGPIQEDLRSHTLLACPPSLYFDPSLPPAFLLDAPPYVTPGQPPAFFCSGFFAPPFGARLRRHNPPCSSPFPLLHYARFSPFIKLVLLKEFTQLFRLSHLVFPESGPIQAKDVPCLPFSVFFNVCCPLHLNHGHPLFPRAPLSPCC